MMENETLEEFRAKIKKLNDEVIYFQPTQKLEKSYQNKDRKPSHHCSRELIVDG